MGSVLHALSHTAWKWERRRRKAHISVKLFVFPCVLFLFPLTEEFPTYAWAMAWPQIRVFNNAERKHCKSAPWTTLWKDNLNLGGHNFLLSLGSSWLCSAQDVTGFFWNSNQCLRSAGRTRKSVRPGRYTAPYFTRSSLFLNGWVMAREMGPH